MEYIDKLLVAQRNFEYIPNQTWLSEWYYPVGISVCYLATIFILRGVMSKLNPLNVKLLSALHNLNLLIISIVCFVGMVYGILDQLMVRFHPATASRPLNVASKYKRPDLITGVYSPSDAPASCPGEILPFLPSRSLPSRLFVCLFFFFTYVIALRNFFPNVGFYHL
jgi:hypothetical protein